MAQIAKVNNEVAIKNDETAVTYQISGGQEISLTHAAVKQLTNNNKYITEGEIELFINLCKFQKLNPFTREAYLVKFDSEKPAQQITSLGAFQRIADEQPNYEGIEDGIVVQAKNGSILDRVGCIMYPGETLLGGWAKVYRSDRKIPSIARLDVKEYTKGQATWNNMPKTMINKCAKVAALRKAFPNAFQGMYEEDEIKNTVDNNINIPNENIDTSKSYDIDTETGEVKNVIEVEATVTDVVDTNTDNIVEPIIENATSTNNDDEEGIEYINYDTEYKNNKDKYERAPYPDGRNPYDAETRTIRVRRIN